jgi:hypothetical protein
VCIVPYEKTIGGRIDNSLAHSLGYTSAPDPLGKALKIGQFKSDNKGASVVAGTQGRSLALNQQLMNMPRINNR